MATETEYINGTCTCRLDGPPPPPPTPSIQVRLMHLLTYSSVGVSLLALFILTLLSVHLLWKCISKRLWLFPCYPTRFTALNAGTLALLGIFIKSPKVYSTDEGPQELFPQLFHVTGSVLACLFIGACMPSIPSTDRRQMWSNFAGTALLLVTIIFDILFYRISPAKIAFFEDKSLLYIYLDVQVACLILFLLLVSLQTFSMDELTSDVAACVLKRLQQLEMGAISGAEKQVLSWSWEGLDRTTCVKLMMAMTSNLQNVASRSPSQAMLLALILLPTAMLGKLNLPKRLLPRFPGFGLFSLVPDVNILLCGFICLSRSLRLAMYDDRPLPLLFFDTHPFYSHRKVKNFVLHLNAGPLRPLHPTIWKRITFTLKSTVYCILFFIMLLLISPLYGLMLTCTISTHILATLFVRMSKLPLLVLTDWLPVNTFFLGIRSKFMRCFVTTQMPVNAEPLHVDLAAGVICIPGEDPHIVQKLFEGSGRLVIQRCIKKAESKPIQALETILRMSNQACYLKTNTVYEVLAQKGTPNVPMLHVGNYGDQYGWSLTILTLLDVLSIVEVDAFGTYKRTMATMEAYKQAIQIVAVVDETHAPTVCSKETYLKASTALWASLLNKKMSCQQKASRRGVQATTPVHILGMHLETARRQLQKHSHGFPWTMEVVTAYTAYTVCQNLQSWCMDVEMAMRESAPNQCLIERIHYLTVEVLAACLCSLPAVLETRTSRAVCDGNEGEIETAIFLIHQAKEVWKKLQWPLYTVASSNISAAGFTLQQYWLQPKQATYDAAVSIKGTGICQGSTCHLYLS